MAGVANWQAKITIDVEDLKKRITEAEGELNGITSKDHKIKLDLDTKTLENAVKKLDRMLESLGKGTDDFKQFENLSKQLSSITSDINNISRAFSSMNDGSELVNNIKSIDASLSTLSQHFVTEVSGKMATAIKDTKATLADVGDGKELTPLLQTIGKIEGAIKELTTSVKGVNLNMNIDLGSDDELKAKVEAKTAGVLHAYEKLFSQIKQSGQLSQAEQGIVDNFNIGDFDGMEAKISEYERVIKELRATQKSVYGKDYLRNDIDKNYWTAVSGAKQALSLAKKSGGQDNVLQNVFGGTDLSEVIVQLTTIAGKLDNIVSVSQELKASFTQGLNVNTSVEEITKLTDRVKELESELAKIKTPTTLPSNESNISSGSNENDIKNGTKSNAIAKQQAKIIKEEWTNAVKVVKEYESAVTKLNNLKASDKGLGTKSNEIAEQEKKIDDMKSSFEAAQTTLLSFFSSIDKFNSIPVSSIKEVQEAIKLIQTAANGSTESLAKLEDALRNIKTNQFKKIDDRFGKYSKQYTSLENSPAGYQHNDKYKAELEEYNNQLNAIKVKIQAIKDQDIDVVDQKDLSELDKMYTKLDKINASLSHTPATQKGSTKESRQKVFNMINELKQFTGMAKESKLELEAMEQRFKNLGANINVSEAISEVKAFKSQLVATNQTTKNLLDTVKEKAWYGWAAQLAGMFSFYDVINGFRQVTSTVIDLNTQITELAKVSEQSSKQIYDDFSSYADIAKEVRGTISDTIVATADWSKNGYSIPDSKQLAEVSQLYKNVGDGINIDEANESLISTLQGFKLEADQAEHIVDVFNEVSNNEAISSGGIGDALQRSAASFNAASTSLEKSVSLVTATNSVLQDPEKVGNMWRTVSARLRGSETELKEMGADTDGLVTSTSKLQALVKGITGFDIMKDKDTYKDIYDIVLGIGEKWQDLSDIDRASLLEALAGKQQSNALAAALNNIDVLKKSYGEAMNAQGSAREENEEYAKSIQASIDLTKAKLEELSADLLSSDFLKGAIDAGGKFIDVLDGIVKSGSAIPAVATAISAALSFKNVGRVKIVALM